MRISMTIFTRLWHVAADTLAQRQIKRILVLDDCRRLHNQTYPLKCCRHYALCGVEQTSLGMFLFEENAATVCSDLVGEVSSQTGNRWANLSRNASWTN